MEVQGFISVHRNLKEKGYYSDSEFVHLWIHILLSVNWKSKELLWNGKLITVQPGQFITGRKALAQETGIKEWKIERILSVFENAQQIAQSTNNRFRLVTVLNWEKWQEAQQPNAQKVNNGSTANRQRTDTNNKENKENNENKNTISKTVVTVDNGSIPLIIEKFKGVNPSYQRLFANITEREATERLVKQYGQEELGKLVDSLTDIVNKPYAPRITTPYELERNMGKLKIFVNQKPKINHTII